MQVQFNWRSSLAITLATAFIAVIITAGGLLIIASTAEAHANVHCAHYNKTHYHTATKRVISAYKGHAGRAAGGGYIHKVRVTWQTKITGGYWVNTSAATYLRTCAT